MGIYCMDNVNAFGCHSVFFYYGKAHLIVNLYHYIVNGISDNEFTYLYLEPSILNEIRNRLSESEFKKVGILTCDTLLRAVENGHKDLQNIIGHHSSAAINKGFRGARFFIQIGQFLNDLGDNLFQVERAITDSVQGFKASVVCAYDSESYITGKIPLDYDILRNILKTHTHRLSGFKMVKIEGESL